MKRKLFLLFPLLLLLAGSLFGQTTAESPYPVLFVHGFNSSDETWSAVVTELQKVFGSYSIDNNVIHFVLNASSTSTNIFGEDGTPSDAWSMSIPNPYTPDDDVRFRFVKGEPTILSSSLYAVNFNASLTTSGELQIGDPGGSNGQSRNNQSAIVKQEYAISQAIRKIREVTGKDKVILVTHSMGGLAARGYLQRIDPVTHKHRWWIDPNSEDGHKVALLVTLDTPHLGSNFVENIEDLKSKVEILPSPLDDVVKIFLTALDAAVDWEKSEAARDLRWDNTIEEGSTTPGGYLYNTSEVNLQPFAGDFDNIDVTCDGKTDSPIQPLNEPGTTRDVAAHTQLSDFARISFTICRA